MQHTLAFFGGWGWTEVLLLAAVGVLIFGKRLPDVGRSIGKSIVEFKKGLGGIEDDIDQVGSRPAPPPRIEPPPPASTTDTAQSQPTSTDNSTSEHTV